MNIPKILYKYRDLKSGHAEKILSDGEIYFATTNQLAEHKEKASFVLSKSAWVNDENNSLMYLSSEESKNRLMKVVRVTPEQWLEIFCSKLPKYSYEKECRLFYTKGKHVSEFVRHAIKEIIFGYKVSLDEILRVKALVGDLSGINFFIAQKIDNKVQIKDLNLEKCLEVD